MNEGDVVLHADVDAVPLRPGAIRRLAEAPECLDAELCLARDEDGFQLLNSGVMLLRKRSGRRAEALLEATAAAFDETPAARRRVLLPFGEQTALHALLLPGVAAAAAAAGTVGDLHGGAMGFTGGASFEAPPGSSFAGLRWGLLAARRVAGGRTPKPELKGVAEVYHATFCEGNAGKTRAVREALRVLT